MLFLRALSQRPCDASVYGHDCYLEKIRFILSDRFDFHMIESLSLAGRGRESVP